MAAVPPFAEQLSLSGESVGSHHDPAQPGRTSHGGL